MKKPKAGEVDRVSTHTAVSRAVKKSSHKVARTHSVAASVPVTNKGVKKGSTKTSVSRSVRKIKDTSATTTRVPSRTPHVSSGRVRITAVRQLDKKIQIIENISRSRKKGISHTVHERTAPTVPVTRHLRVLSLHVKRSIQAPFALGVAHAGKVARIATTSGVATLMIGVMLSAYNLHAVSAALSVSQGSQRAETISSGCDPSASTCTSTTTSGAGGTPGTAGSVDTTPDADIVISLNTNTLSSTVPITITVPYALRIELIAKNKKTNLTQKIEMATQQTDLVWRAFWQTTMFDDGEYVVSAIITNQFGSYTETGDVYVVENYPANTAETTDTADSSPAGATTTTVSNTQPSQTQTTTTTPSTTTVSATTTQTLSKPMTPSVFPLTVELSMPEPLSGTVRIRSFVEGASFVEHFIKPSASPSFSLLGRSSLRSGGEWRFEFDTKAFQNGEYDIRTLAAFPSGSSTVQVLRSQTITNTSLVAPTTTTKSSTTTLPFQPSETVIVTPITFEFTKKNPLTEQVDVYIEAVGMHFIELYALPQGTLTPRYLGLAYQHDADMWRFRFDTTVLPNGEYAFYARVKNQYGFADSDRIPITISNETKTQVPEESVAYVETLFSTSVESDAIMGTTPQTELQQTPTVLPVLETQREVLTRELGTAYSDEIASLLDEYYASLSLIMRDFAQAVRANDVEKERELLDALEALRGEIRERIPAGEDQRDIITKLDNHMETIAKDLRERTERSEALIKERVGDALTTDTDQDGITDFDEVHLYKTDPFSADTDRDGFIDGIEILNGFDPRNSARQANVVYESPKEQGVIRDDILSVDSITSLSTDASEAATPKAHIAGRGLPHSFVTLYIFSTPIVVTVKTDADGNWSYIFEKELEDGSHEVYVGITDNAGKIVAKSNPLSFVKTAQAFTPVDAAGALITAEPTPPSLVTDSALLAIGSIGIVALGLILILLGLHVRPKEPEPSFAS